MASRKSPLFDTATTVGQVMSFLGVSALCGLLAVGLIFPLAASGGAVASAGSEILDEVPAEMSEEPLSTPSHIYANDGETLLATYYAEYRVPVDIDDISEEMQNAIVSIEDERFYEHGGVDARGTARALMHNFSSSTQQGASTITMQYVNNVLNNAHVVRGDVDSVLAAGIQDKTYADKLREMQQSVTVEQEMTKDEILEGYLNLVLLGGQVYGVEAAAQTYWGISASELDLAQAATLAGMVQSPNYYNPSVNPEASVDRRNMVLDTMERNGFITAEERDEAQDEGLNLNEGTAERSGCVEAPFANYFCDYVVADLLDEDGFGEILGEDGDTRENLLMRGGLEIVSTVDADAQREAEDEVMETVPQGDSSQAAATLVSVEPETGNIIAMAQSTEYHPDADVAEGRTTMNLNTNSDRGASGGFPVGSTLKPFVAAAWIEEGGSMDDVVDASVTEYDYGEMWEASCMPGGQVRLDPDGTSDSSSAWDLENVGGREHDMTVDYGLYYSVNTATVAEAYDMDLCAITDVTDRANIVSASTGEGLRADQPSFILGGTELSPLTLASAYTTFANDGVQCGVRSILSVTDSQGNEYDVPESDCEEVIDSEVIAEVNDTLVNLAEMQAGNGDTPFPMLGKTGTSGENSNTWFAGSTKGLTTVAQVGRWQDNAPLNDVPINGESYEWFYGSDVAMPMWYDYMTTVGGDYDTDDFTEASDSPFSDRRESRYSRGDATGSGSSSNSDDDDDDD